MIASREVFRALQPTLNPERLVFLDEAGCNAAMKSRYARSRRGRRAHDHKPSHWGENVTMIGAIRASGFATMMSLPGPTTGEVFVTFMQEFLAPVLEPGDCVILDNLAAHKVDGVRQAIEKVGATLVYLPPYSPDLNPIEMCWSKVKHFLRKAAARTLDSLNDAIADAMAAVTPADCLGWIRHCGYSPPTA